MTTPGNDIGSAVAELELELEVEAKNRATVDALYKALGKGETETVAKVVASDLEWWFHGPPGCQHMMRVLTGESAGHGEFRFEPRSIEVVGDCVIAEGWEGAKAYWVHVWTLKDGVITQFREYFNTWLTVKGVNPHQAWEIGHQHHHHHHLGLTLWQSHPRDLYNRSLPGVLLAI